MEGRFFKDNLSVLGDVGVGTNSPRGPLEVYAASDSTLVIERYTSNGIQLRADDSANSPIRLGFEAYLYDFKNGSGTSRLYIDASGNVGIGTVTPSQKLHVQGNLRVTGAYYDSNNEDGTSDQVLTSTGSGGTDWKSLSDIGDTVTGCGTTNYVTKWCNGPNSDLTDSIIYDNGTNVGLSTASPSAKLHVHSTTGILHTGDDYSSWVLKYLSNQGSGSAVINYYLIAAKTQTNVRFDGVLKGARQVGTSATGSGGARITFYTNNAGTPLATGGLESWATDSYGHPIFKLVELTYNSVEYYAIEISPSTSWSAGFAHVQFEGYANNVLFTSLGTASVSGVTEFSGEESVFSYKYGNLGIGTTNPTQKLYVSGNAVVDGNIHLETCGQCITFYGNCDGSHAITSRSLNGSTSDDLRINSYASVFVNLDSNNNNSSGADFMIGRHGGSSNTISDLFFKVDGETGNVGIGTTSPQGKLDINTETAEPTHVYINGEVNQNKLLYFRHYANSEAAANNVALGYIGSNGIDNLLSLGHLNSSGTDVPIMHLTEAGNVGIGTTSPTSSLHIADPSAPAIITLERTDTTVFGGNSIGYINFRGGHSTIADVASIEVWAQESWNNDDSPTYMSFYTTPNASTTKVEAMRIDMDGNVGIGTTYPRAILDVTTAVDGDSFPSRITSTDGSFTDEQKLGIEFAQNATVLNQFYSKYDISLGGWGFGFKGYNTSVSPAGLTDELFTIGANGNVGIGTTSPGYGLDVAGDAAANFVGKVSTGASGATNDPFRLEYDTNSWMMGVAPNASVGNLTWGLFWAGNSGAAYGTNGAGGPGNIWSNSSNPNEFAFVGSGSTKWSLWGNDGSTWQAGDALIAGNLGIGTTNPSSKFTVAEGTDQHGVEIQPGTVSYIQAYDRATSDYGDLSIDAQTLRFATDNGAERVRIDASGNVGIGTANPLFKLHVNGDIYQDTGYSIYSNANRGWYRGNYTTTGSGVSNGKIVTLNPSHGQTASNVYHYIFELTTIGTSTDTGATYIGVYSANASAWSLRAVSLSGDHSNHPQLSVSGNNFTVYTNHSSNYTVVVSVTTVYNGDADSTAHSLGANYQWQRAVNNLYYNDGFVGIGAGTPSQKLHVQGNLRLTGAYYDSNNEDGTSDQVLTSTGLGGTDWKSLSDIGDTVTGCGTTNYVTKWCNGPNSDLTDSIIYDNGTNVGIGTASPSYKLDVIGDISSNGQAIASYRRLRSYDDFTTSTNNTAGWYPLFNWGTTTGDRGGYRVYISYTGGNWGPNTTVLKVYKNWSDDATITIEKYGGTLYLPEVRVIGDASSATVYTLEVYLNALSQGHNFSVYYEALGYDEGGASNVNWANSSLALSTNTGSVIASAKVSSEGIATQNLGISNDIYLGDQIIHMGDTDTYFQFPANDTMRLVANNHQRFNIETTETVVNEDGHDYNFRVEGDTDQNLLLVDAGTDRVGIGITPSQKLHVSGNSLVTGYTYINDTTRYFTAGGSGVKLQTAHGYIQFGPDNASWAHIHTDRGSFYFNKAITVDQGLVQSYNENLSLNASSTTSADIIFKSGGTEHMRMTSDGDFGIGTANPDHLLHLSKTSTTANATSALLVASYDLSDTPSNGTAFTSVVFSGDITNAGMGYLRIENAYNTSTANRWSAIQAGTNYPVYGDGPGALAGDSGHLLLNPYGGNVGIGTTNPQGALEIANTDNATLILRSDSDNNSGSRNSQLLFQIDAGTIKGLVGYDQDSNVMQLSYGGNNNHLVVDSAGNVGIGTGTPSQKLHVQGNLRVTGAFYDSNNSAGSSGEILSSTGSGTDWVSLCQISGVTANGSQTTCYIPKWIDGTNEVIGNSVIYEDASGNIGINCTTPSYKLHVNGSFAATCKSFVINHPTKCGHMLRYGSLESPYHGVRLTGKSCTVCGEAEVSLPDYMHALIHEEDVNVQITNYRHGCTMWVDDVDISNNNFKVKTETDETKEFYWTFTAERKDVDRMQTEYRNV